MSKNSALAIPALEGRLGEVREFVSRFCRHAGLPERGAANLRLAVDQVCSFGIRRAYASGSGELRVELESDRGWLDVRVRDNGETLQGLDKPRSLMAWLEEQARSDAASVQLPQLVDRIEYTTSSDGNCWHLRKRLPARPRFQGSLRARYAVRSALVLGVLIGIACVPLWILEGNRQRQSEEQALHTLAYGLVESARPVLRQGDRDSEARSLLQEAVQATRRREKRLLSLQVIDEEGLIWASDRSSALFTKFTDAGNFGEPDAQGEQKNLRRIEGHPVMMFSVPVLRGERGSPPLGRVFLTMRWQHVESRVQDARVRLLLGALLLYVVSTVVVVALIGGILQSVQKVLDTMRSFQTEEDGFALEGQGEVGALAQAFRQVTSRMQAAESHAKRADGLRKDMVLAREIQETILPQEPPEVPGYELAKYYKPAEDVGGDYYDFLQVNDDMVGIVVADVSGKGVSGSLVMGMLRTALRMEARDNTNAGDVLARMNAFLSSDMRKGMFVTMFYVILDSRNRVVSYASAGHTPMVLYRAETAETFFLKPRGFPVGLRLPDEQTFGRSLDVERLQLHEGDLLLLYTDGITEALNARREQYGEERMLEIVRQTAGGSAQGCVEALRQDIKRFIGHTPQSDDITIVAIRETSAARSERGSVRRKLQDLVEKEGLSVEEACEKLHVSPSTYYRFQHAQRATLQRPVTASIRDGSSDSAPTDSPQESNDARSNAAPTTGAPPTAPPPALSTAPTVAGPAPVTPTVRASSGAGPVMQSQELKGRVEPLSSHPGAALVSLEGFIDSSSCAEMEAFLRNLHESWKQIILDLSGILYLSSRAWGILASAASELDGQQGQLLLTGLNAEVADVHKMLGFEDVLPTYATLHEATRNLEEIGDGVTENEVSEIPANASSGEATDKRSNRRARRAEARRRRRERKALEPTPRIETPPVPVTEGQWVADSPETAGEWESLRVISGCVGPQGEVRLLGIEGILDTVSTRRFAQVLESRLQAGDIRFLVDLSRTEFISSAGWGVFASALRELRAQGGDLKLFGMGRELKQIFEMLGLGAVLESFDVMAAALEAFGLVAPSEAPSESHPTPESHHDIEALPEVPVVPEQIGRLQISMQPFGSSGNATRLILEGELTGSEVRELAEWLQASGGPVAQANRLLLLDARRVQSMDEDHWLRLLEQHVEQSDSWGRVHMLRPEMHCPLPMELAFPVHETLEEALQAFQNRSTASLEYRRLDDPARFAADSSVRREGWGEYLQLLRQAQGKENP